MSVCLFFQVFRTLVETTKDIKGAKVENHKFCTSVHYRNVEEKVSIFTFFDIREINELGMLIEPYTDCCFVFDN